METSSFSGSSSFQEDFSFRTTSQTSGQSSGSKGAESEYAEVTISATTTSVTPNFNQNIDALDALQKSRAIEVIYPASWQKNLSIFSLLLDFNLKNVIFKLKINGFSDQHKHGY